jgi:type II secretory pathway predicted ATPase ExeA
MREIVSALSGNENVGQRRAVVTGMSGCGKTQISLKYAYDHDDV